MFSKQQTKSDLAKMPTKFDPPALSAPDGGPPRKTAPKVASLVAENITLEGSLSGEGELHIDGIVRGDVRIAKLTIGDTGHVEGSIYADVVEARGRVIGAITAKQVRLYGTSYVDGDITHEQLAMETGAFFQGRSLKFQRPPAPQPAATAPSSSSSSLPAAASTDASPIKSGLEVPVAPASSAPQPKPVF
ncbi:polymer-forming cytoskeletal protein [Phenylobacterium sp.]|uniref:bactofilin family protein n=1 Tax=Phenylobacterium sp. TaxID=1871053 RepID=UPI00272F1379|nr:polymer-forming cytoskeletal protein [Phenylobacterium sp.]MDP1619151.1 polymer-forming cytoskeletal protein [Phenylobacterium sp.]MDP1987027.1 polymer-forming cytoskeletal protein [Phenylobacterium sp.]